MCGIEGEEKEKEGKDLDEFAVEGTVPSSYR